MVEAEVVKVVMRYTDMSVITLEMSLLCDDQYFKLRYLDIIFLIFFAKYEVIVYAMLWYYIFVGCIATDIALWGRCVAPSWICYHIQYLASLSASILICLHSSILLYVSP